jgi:polar amino acid transport system substrate-binding protein
MTRSAVKGALLVVVALLVAACGGGASADSAPSGNPLHDMLPESVQQSGTLTIGGSTAVAPYLYKDGATVVGFEKELMDALGSALGVRIEFVDTGFPALVPGLQSRKLDVAMGDFTDTPERQQAVDFIDYTTSYQILLVQRGNPKGLRSVDDLCGATVASAVGSLSDKLAVEQDTRCTDTGRPGVTVLRLEDAANTTLQVQTARADAVIIDYVIGRHIAENSEHSEVAGEPFYEQFHGAAVRKGNDELRDALVAAFTEIIRNGSYGKILEKWEMQRLAMPAPIVNAAAKP